MAVYAYQDDFNWKKDPSRTNCCNREDMTLLVRNFNFELSTPTSASSTLRSQSTSFNANSESFVLGSRFDPQLYSFSNNINETLTEASIATSDSSDQMKSTQSQNVMLDEDGRIAPYVDFTNFYQAVRKAKTEGVIPEEAIY